MRKDCVDRVRYLCEVLLLVRWWRRDTTATTTMSCTATNDVCISRRTRTYMSDVSPVASCRRVWCASQMSTVRSDSDEDSFVCVSVGVCVSHLLLQLTSFAHTHLRKHTLTHVCARALSTHLGLLFAAGRRDDFILLVLATAGTFELDRARCLRAFRARSACKCYATMCRFVSCLLCAMRCSKFLIKHLTEPMKRSCYNIS